MFIVFIELDINYNNTFNTVVYMYINDLYFYKRNFAMRLHRLYLYIIILKSRVSKLK